MRMRSFDFVGLFAIDFIYHRYCWASALAQLTWLLGGREFTGLRLHASQSISRADSMST